MDPTKGMGKFKLQIPYGLGSRRCQLIVVCLPEIVDAVKRSEVRS